jgi:hypothetical protein
MRSVIDELKRSQPSPSGTSINVIDPIGFRRTLFHRIEAEERMTALGASSKMNNHPEVIPTWSSLLLCLALNKT